MAARASLTLPLALLVSMALGSGAHAADFEDMSRCSSADVKALKVFNVGQASLFRADCGAADPLAPPMRLAFGYNREVPGDAFAKAARKMAEDLTGKDARELLRSKELRSAAKAPAPTAAKPTGVDKPEASSL